MQTTTRSLAVFLHFIVTRGAEMAADLRRHDTSSMQPGSECCATPQNLPLTRRDPKRPTFLTRTRLPALAAVAGTRAAEDGCRAAADCRNTPQPAHAATKVAATTGQAPILLMPCRRPSHPPGWGIGPAGPGGGCRAAARGARLDRAGRSRPPCPICTPANPQRAITGRSARRQRAIYAPDAAK